VIAHGLQSSEHHSVSAGVYIRRTTLAHLPVCFAPLMSCRLLLLLPRMVADVLALALLDCFLLVNAVCAAVIFIIVLHRARGWEADVG